MARAAHKPRRNIRQYSPPGFLGPQQNPQQGPAEMSARTAPGQPTNPPARRSSTRPTGMAARTAGFGPFHGHRSPVAMGCYSHEAEQAVGTGVWILRWWYCHRKWNQTHQTTGGKTGGGRRTDASSTSTSSCRSRTRSCGRMRTSSGRTMLASGTSSNKSGCSNKPNTNCRCAGTRCSRGSSNDSKRRQCCWIQCSNMRESRTRWQCCSTSCKNRSNNSSKRRQRWSRQRNNMSKARARCQRCSTSCSDRHWRQYYQKELAAQQDGAAKQKSADAQEVARLKAELGWAEGEAGHVLSDVKLLRSSCRFFIGPWKNLALTALDSYGQALEQFGSYSP